ncbi:hypothetical protein EU537_12160 [Candidatus Thorarchaeota archaeon]|nr:MAG: hypothetical protein EU537_12160 [Candidatus Thorarchaeota archaeon]
MDVRRKFEQSLQDTVEEWKSREEVRGIFVYGSYVRGTATMSSDLDVVIIWNEDEAPARLIARHKGVLIDMDFMTPEGIEVILEDEATDAFEVAGVISRLRGARIEYDPDKLLVDWLSRVEDYTWPEEMIDRVKERILESLSYAKKFLEKGDAASANYAMRLGILRLARLVLMRNNNFSIIKPAEVLSELRMLDPVSYQLFLRSFKLKGVSENQLMIILDDIKKWLIEAVERFEREDRTEEEVINLLTQAQRYYYGANGLTINGDYELAVLEIRRCIPMIGMALLRLSEIPLEREDALLKSLKENEKEFYEEIIMEYGGYDMQPKGIERAIGEATFLVNRL